MGIINLVRRRFDVLLNKKITEMTRLKKSLPLQEKKSFLLCA